ncbi:conserved hypothetical protein [Ricinus communis]|uniref:NB-ARC domain-containing protein n=1 Tax=Ricinus communis TaxID=3988 RepID=B9RQC2_RICCO|nr:conserved hypothetical protein [Ricinus communis]
MIVGEAILESLSGDAERLDDMWEDGLEKWEQLRHSLLGSLLGSKILVTTHSEIVARNMGCSRNNVLQLGKFPSEQCWSIFSRVTFFDRDNEEHARLESIGRYIVEKCGGLSLSAKALGSLLRLNSSVQELRNMLDSELHKLPGIWEA